MLYPDAAISGRLAVGTFVRAKDQLTTFDAPREAAASIATAARERPLLLVDIDGVISLFSPLGRERPQGSFHWIEGMPHILSATAAGHLLALAGCYEMVWASGWEERANEHLPHLLGLPRLAHLRFERAVGRTNAHWKLDAIGAHAGERALAWVDDAFNDACHEWASSRVAPTLLVQTSPASGLTQREADALRDWALTLRKTPVH
jgi:hypothetical protein